MTREAPTTPQPPKKPSTMKLWWAQRKIRGNILSQLLDALELFNVKIGNKRETENNPLDVNKNWEIVFSKGSNVEKKDASDVLGHIENINILDIRKKLFEILDEEPSIESANKAKMKESIRNFIESQFLINRRLLEDPFEESSFKEKSEKVELETGKKYNPTPQELKRRENRLMHKKFRRYYTKYAERKLGITQEEQKFISSLYTPLISFLYSKDSNFIDNDFGITYDGINYLGQNIQILPEDLKNYLISLLKNQAEEFFNIDGSINQDGLDYLGQDIPILLKDLKEYFVTLLKSHQFLSELKGHQVEEFFNIDGSINQDGLDYLGQHIPSLPKKYTKFLIEQFNGETNKLLNNDGSINQDLLNYIGKNFQNFPRVIRNSVIKILSQHAEGFLNDDGTISRDGLSYIKQKFDRFSLKGKKSIYYRDICLALANLLYSKNKRFLNKDGSINEKGLEYIGHIIYKTIQNIPLTKSSKSFEKIFHDGAYGFLRREGAVGTLDEYVEVIMYLMSIDNFNAYAEGGKQGEIEWYKTKKSFLNSIFTTHSVEDGSQDILINKIRIHEKLAEERESAGKTLKNSIDYKFSERFKTESSKSLKAGGRTKDIKDESGVRVTYYSPKEGSNEIKNSILALSKEYFDRISQINGLSVESIQIDKKGEFVNDDEANEILHELGEYLNCTTIGRYGKKSSPETDSSQPQIHSPQNRILSENQQSAFNDCVLSVRNRKKRKSLLGAISSKYKILNGKKPVPGLQAAYEIANGSVQRGANGDYKDFKFLVKFRADESVYQENNPKKGKKSSNENKTIKLSQEISFYPHDNDLNMGNHNILDLEKKIFNRVKAMSDEDLGKSISLGRLRRFTEEAIADYAHEIDTYEHQIDEGVFPKPKNDAYKYLVFDDHTKFCIKGLKCRDKFNSKIFDEVITHILNYFIVKNKIFYINKDGTTHSGLIQPEWLQDESQYSNRRFTTSDMLRNIALDFSYDNQYICFYTKNSNTREYKNFYRVCLGDLGDFIRLEKFANDPD